MWPAVAGDDDRAAAAVARLIDDIGFDPVLLGRLSRSGVPQPGSPVFGADLDRHRPRSAPTSTATAPCVGTDRLAAR